MFLFHIHVSLSPFLFLKKAVKKFSQVKIKKKNSPDAAKRPLGAKASWLKNRLKSF